MPFALTVLAAMLRYDLMDTGTLGMDGVLSVLRQPSFGGASVTIPHKEAIAKHMDELSPSARAIGAVNTVIRDGDKRSFGLASAVNASASGCGTSSTRRRDVCVRCACMLTAVRSRGRDFDAQQKVTATVSGFTMYRLAPGRRHGR